MKPEPVRVLIVDDEPEIRELLRRCLSRWGYTADLAPSAEIAADTMAAAPAHILLCDVRMPGQGGLWLAAHVHVNWPDTAVIMATAADDVETVRQSRKVGAVDYVLKPFDLALLKQALERASGRIQFRPSCSTL